MSYCRFREGQSDVYLYHDIDGYYHCCGCKLSGDARLETLAEALAHLEAHRKAGHKVPQYAFDRVCLEMTVEFQSVQCEHRENDGCCTSENNATPECTPWACWRVASEE